MPSQIITVTIQAALFSALSTTLAQSITAYQQHTQTLQTFASNATFPKSPSYSHTHAHTQLPSATQSLLQAFNLYSILSFMLIAIIMTPPNYLYQRFLEDNFPSKLAKARSGGTIKGNDKGKLERERLSKSNTLAKLCLDQSIGAMANTAGLIVLAGLAKGRSVSQVFGCDLQRVSYLSMSPVLSTSPASLCFVATSAGPMSIQALRLISIVRTSSPCSLPAGASGQQSRY